MRNISKSDCLLEFVLSESVFDSLDADDSHFLSVA